MTQSIEGALLSACVKNGELDYLWLWIDHTRRLPRWWIALFVLNLILDGIIRGFVPVWRLIVAVWYVSLTVY